MASLRQLLFRILAVLLCIYEVSSNPTISEHFDDTDCSQINCSDYECPSDSSFYEENIYEILPDIPDHTISPSDHLHEDDLPFYPRFRRRRNIQFDSIMPYEESLKKCCINKCTCNKCPKFDCPPTYVAVITQESQGIPGDCCDKYKCVPNVDCANEKANMTYWIDSCTVCKCSKKGLCESLCEEQHCPNCFSETKGYKYNGDTWWDDKCTSCTCECGNKRCQISSCKPLNCLNQITLEDKCCPQCVDVITIDGSNHQSTFNENKEPNEILVIQTTTETFTNQTEQTTKVSTSTESIQTTTTAAPTTETERASDSETTSPTTTQTPTSTLIETLPSSTAETTSSTFFPSTTELITSSQTTTESTASTITSTSSETTSLSPSPSSTPETTTVPPKTSPSESSTSSPELPRTESTLASTNLQDSSSAASTTFSTFISTKVLTTLSSTSSDEFWTPSTSTPIPELPQSSNLQNAPNLTYFFLSLFFFLFFILIVIYCFWQRLNKDKTGKKYDPNIKETDIGCITPILKEV